MSHYIQIDEEGYFLQQGIRVQDADFAIHLFENLKPVNYGWTTYFDQQEIIVEPFDEPLLAHQVYHPASHQWEIEMPYGWRQPFDPHHLTLDEWDRFHGHTKNGIAFVFSRSAQFEFFNLCDEFSDDSITVEGETIRISNWLQAKEQVSSAQFWNDIYLNEQRPGFDLEKPSPSLVHMLNKIKIPKSRILVLGAGPGHDAAYFANQGHLVTAVDFSPKGLHKAQGRYQNLENLKFVESDVFQLPRQFDHSFDLVFEHTLYCAINPERRNELMQVWKRVLIDKGFLMGIFFAMDKPQGPPYGGSEWEIRERLKRSFQFLYWERVHGLEHRDGREFIIYAMKT